MSIAAKFRRLAKPLSDTILHPQWLILRNARRSRQHIASRVRGRMLDVGCGNKTLADVLPESVEYVGLDYPTTVALGYGGEADVFGDAQNLPFQDNSFDAVTVLDVMEHLRSPTVAFSEAVRVTRPDGLIIVQTPFLYPLHDLPHDYQRWTGEGLMQLAVCHPLERVLLAHHGRSLETAALLLNLALAKGMQEAIPLHHPIVLLLPLAVLLIPLINVLGWLGSRMLPDTGFMPMGYIAIFRKLS